MNWTGGRLQRHSVTNSNRILKIQRKHFADAQVRSRSRWQKPSLAQKIHSPLRPREALKNGTATAQDWLQEQHHDTSAQCHNQLLLTEQSKHQNSRLNSDKTSPNVKSEYAEHTPQPTLNTFEDFQKVLLSRSDWLGLSTSKPVNLGFNPSGMKKRIGRHRRISNTQNRSRERIQVAVGIDKTAPIADTIATTPSTRRGTDPITMTGSDSSKLHGNALLLRPHRIKHTESYRSSLSNSVYSDMPSYNLSDDNMHFSQNAEIRIQEQHLCSEISQPQLYWPALSMADPAFEFRPKLINEDFAVYDTSFSADDQYQAGIYPPNPSLPCSGKHISEVTSIEDGENIISFASERCHRIRDRDNIMPVTEFSCPSLVPANVWTTEQELEHNIGAEESDDQQQSSCDKFHFANVPNCEHLITTKVRDGEKHLGLGISNLSFAFRANDQPDRMVDNLRGYKAGDNHNRVITSIGIPSPMYVGHQSRSVLSTGSCWTPRKTPDQAIREIQITDDCFPRGSVIPRTETSHVITSWEGNSSVGGENDAWIQYIFPSTSQHMGKDVRVSPHSSSKIQSSNNSFHDSDRGLLPRPGLQPFATVNQSGPGSERSFSPSSHVAPITQRPSISPRSQDLGTGDSDSINTKDRLFDGQMTAKPDQNDNPDFQSKFTRTIPDFDRIRHGIEDDVSAVRPGN